MRSERWKLHLSVAFLVVAAMILALTPAVADPLADTDEYPDVAFLARNDVPFDAQTAASMAAQLGAPMFITNPNALSDAAADGIADLDPDVLIVAGGVFAVSDDVANAAADQCSPTCTIDRYAGTGRDETAAALAKIADEYGFDRPALIGDDQVVGDLHVGGAAIVDSLTVQQNDLVTHLNADLLDGMSAGDFAAATIHEDETEDDPVTVPSNGEDVELSTLALDLPDHCSDGSTRHRLVAHGSVLAFLFANGHEVVARIEAVERGESLSSLTPDVTVATLSTLDSLTQSLETLRVQRVFTNVEPGTQVFELLADASATRSSTVWAANNPAFRVFGAGWTCGP